MSIFKTAEAGARLSDRAFLQRKDQLRLDLIDRQQRVRAAAEFPIILVLAGVRGAGIIDTLNLLNTWMDPRWIASIALDQRTDEETERPRFWRYWRTLPANGAMGVYLGGWYADPIAAYAQRRRDRETFAGYLRRIQAFERTLTDNGALIVKFWLHLSAAKHRQVRDSHRIDPVFGFRASDAAWPDHSDYRPYLDAAAKGLSATDTAAAPWHVIDGADDNFRRIAVLETLRDAMGRHLKAWEKHGGPPKMAPAKTAPAKTLVRADIHKNKPLDDVDLSKTLSDEAYGTAFSAVQRRLYAAQAAARAAGLSSVIAFEGWDAAGKGGAIRRLTYCLSAYNYHVVPIAAPTEEERKHHYLWRFWRHLPRAGRITIFDRTWYGRVLVERVDKLIPKPTWKRAYREILDFEDELLAHGIVLIKFWLHIDRKEQHRRLKERRDTTYKRWKLNDDDWAAYGKYKDYTKAANEMITATSTAAAPWHVIPGDDKHYARIAVLETVAAALERGVAHAAKKAKP